VLLELYGRHKQATILFYGSTVDHLPPVPNMQFSKDPVMLLSIVESLDKKVKHAPLISQLLR
jgi:hypothetical protein